MNEIIEIALKAVKETDWVGSNIQPTLDHALTCINLDTFNSGYYIPKARRINGVRGYFLINEDGTTHYESRAIKLDDGTFNIEYITTEGFSVFESAYRSIEQKINSL